MEAGFPKFRIFKRVYYAKQGGFKTNHMKSMEILPTFMCCMIFACVEYQALQGVPFSEKLRHRGKRTHGSSQRYGRILANSTNRHIEKMPGTV
jgi:hypothetical protein